MTLTRVGKSLLVTLRLNTNKGEEYFIEAKPVCEKEDVYRDKFFW